MNLSRRGLLRLGATATAGAALSPLLAACGGGAGSAPATKAQGLTVKLPAYVPLSGAAKPDLPGTAAGVPEGYFTYPKELFKSVAKPPMSGGTVTMASKTFLPPPPPREQNAAWQEIEKRLGGRAELMIVPEADWPTKFNTMVAGGNLPDVFPYVSTQGVNNLPAFVASQCADLTPFLSGDAVKEYPNLAAIPQVFWKQGIVAGKLYGIPIPRNLVGGMGFYRADLFAAAGVGDLTELSDLDRLFEALKAVTNPKEKRWGLVTATGAAYGLTIFGQLFGCPYEWRLDKATGKLTHQIETEEYRAAVEYTRKLREAGVIYPGSEGFDSLKRKNEFNAGRAAMTYDGMPAFLGPVGYLQTQKKIDPKADPRPMVPIGGKATAYLNNIVFATNFVKKADEAKVKEILRVVDFFAAPFGSEEYTLIQYGVADTDHTRDDKGNPVLTEQGAKDTTVPWKFLGAPTQPVFDSSSSEAVKLVHDALAKMIAVGVEDPTAGLFSPTSENRYESLFTMRTDRVTSIIAGRAPVSDLDRLVKDWKAQGGDKIRAEFESVIQKNGGVG
ncbi:extracellular solute-binding protein [Nonomuraea africana]|uniref:Aldouronate transport system substrate-binding protein n=1 Tax=Nonomuraea africana TaxID=46171 RepID=A0ABR9KNX5_9ACTN|nr:extracellular solute-binding protein [Nonomuraea africana]MBE1563308.1 putative aldouronate transport system substrate-binding protein [Nonomuraea africana]